MSDGAECLQVLKCAQVLGYFVSADVWCPMVLENVRTSQSPASLSVLAAVVRGSEASQLCPHLSDISAVITHRGICHVAEVPSCFRMLPSTVADVGV